jgi:uncharacterized protein involved in exopolysaccharide biosynthesis
MINQSSYPYPFRDEFRRRIQEILRQLELKYDEIVRARTQLDNLRRQGIQLCQEFNSLESNTWRNTTSSNAGTVSTMSSLHLADLQKNLQELDGLISIRTQAYNGLVKESYQNVSRLLSTINDCIRCES